MNNTIENKQIISPIHYLSFTQLLSQMVRCNVERPTLPQTAYVVSPANLTQLCLINLHFVKVFVLLHVVLNPFQLGVWGLGSK